jgi:hypothetical protein
MGVQKLHVELAVAQGENGLQKTFEQGFVALVSEDELEKKIVLGKRISFPSDVLMILIS